jgi:tRNA acetyltransferase TAN1
VNRDDLIRDLAEMVVKRHPENRADLKHPQLAIIVEIIRNMCCLSVVPEYFELRKYNLLELCAPEGGIKVVGGKKEKVAGEKSEETEEEIAVAKQGLQVGADAGKESAGETVASELKDRVKYVKGGVDTDDSKIKPEDRNVEEQTGETGNASKVSETSAEAEV